MWNDRFLYNSGKSINWYKPAKECHLTRTKSRFIQHLWLNVTSHEKCKWLSDINPTFRLLLCLSVKPYLDGCSRNYLLQRQWHKVAKTIRLPCLTACTHMLFPRVLSDNAHQPKSTLWRLRPESLGIASWLTRVPSQFPLFGWQSDLLFIDTL